MKRILIALIILCVATPLHATTMCAAEDTTAVILDPSINGTGYKYDTNTMTWNTTFPYGTIYGVAAWLSVNGGTHGTINYDLDAGGGEKEGGYCWCKMTHPASSRWVMNSAVRVSTFSDICSGRCANNASRDISLRLGLFGSVGK